MNQLDRAVHSTTAQLLSTVSRVRDGDADGIHDARVATRRLRAVLPIAWTGPSTKLERAERDLRRLGRAFGRVRAIDVALEILPRAERLIGAARAIARVRADLVSRQWREQRRAIKRLESFEPPEVESGTMDRLMPSIEWRSDPRWRALDTALLERAELLKAAVNAAGGVYFPNRTHNVRIQAKKLRYLLELAPGSRSDVRRAIKRLRKAQQLLGDVQDRQATANMVADAFSTADGEASDEYRALHNWLIADACDRHAAYLAHRDTLLEICAAIRRDVRNRAFRPLTAGRVLLTIGAAAAPTAAALLTRRLAPQSLQHGAPEPVAREDVAAEHMARAHNRQMSSSRS